MRIGNEDESQPSIKLISLYAGETIGAKIYFSPNESTYESFFSAVGEQVVEGPAVWFEHPQGSYCLMLLHIPNDDYGITPISMVGVEFGDDVIPIYSSRDLSADEHLGCVAVKGLQNIESDGSYTFSNEEDKTVTDFGEDVDVSLWNGVIIGTKE